MREAPGAEEDLARGNRRSRHCGRADGSDRPEWGHHQDRRLAFAVGNDGDQRNDPEGHDPDDGRRREQKGRIAQQAIPAVEYLMDNEGGAAKRWILEGTDYVYPRTTNKILEAFLKAKGVAPEDIKINYTPFGHSDWQTEVAAIKSFAAAGKKTAVVSTINGDANVPFYKELANAGIKASDIPVVAFSVGEEELAGIDTKNLVGHLAAWNYFESVKNPTNDAFIKQWHTFIKSEKRVTNDPMEATYIGFKMWEQAVRQVGKAHRDAE